MSRVLICLLLLFECNRHFFFFFPFLPPLPFLPFFLPPSVCISRVSKRIGGLLSGPFGVFSSNWRSDFSLAPTRPFLPILNTKKSKFESGLLRRPSASDSGVTATVGLAPSSNSPETFSTTALPHGSFVDVVVAACC